MSRQHSPTDDLRDLRAILASDELTTSERIVLMAIVLHRNGESGRCDPSVSRLARQTATDARTVQRTIRRLERAGHVLANRREGRSTCYTVAAPTPGMMPPPAESHPRHDAAPPPAQDRPTPGTVPPERTSERTNERTSVESEGDDRSFPTLDNLPREGRQRLYPPEFEGAFTALPARSHPHPKAAAYRAWRGRVGDVEELFQLEAAADAYREACDAEGKTGTEFVMQAARFFGPGGEWEPYSGAEVGPAKSSTNGDGALVSRHLLGDT